MSAPLEQPLDAITTVKASKPEMDAEKYVDAQKGALRGRLIGYLKQGSPCLKYSCPVLLYLASIGVIIAGEVQQSHGKKFEGNVLVCAGVGLFAVASCTVCICACLSRLRNRDSDQLDYF